MSTSNAIPRLNPNAPADRWPALDGLRGVAILLVFGFHLPWGAFRAGSYGVVLFFVLSGFLITTILLRELHREAKVSLRRFYARRARRLLPALVVAVVAHLVLQLTVLGEPERWWERTWPVLGYMSNFVTMAGVNLMHMTPTWSLAIEEHFYLLWPVVLILIPARWRLRVTAGLAGILLLWRVTLLATGAPDVRVSFGTDTNAFALLLGCALAIAFHEGRLPTPPRHTSAFATAALVAIACIPVHYTDRRVLWGTAPVAILSGLAIYAALFEPFRWLETKVLRWFGTISYGLYLWHFMMINLPWDVMPLRPLFWMTSSSILAAWLSWRVVEEPFLRSRPVGRHRPAMSPSDVAGPVMQPSTD
jgi:peptidoglycan/LPS O-acetylase OafA/YrhL